MCPAFEFNDSTEGWRAGSFSSNGCGLADGQNPASSSNTWNRMHAGRCHDRFMSWHIRISISLQYRCHGYSSTSIVAQTCNTPAKGDVWTKPHFPLKSSDLTNNNNWNKVTQKRCLSPKLRSRHSRRNWWIFSRALKVLTDKRWEIIVTLCLTSAGTYVQGHLANRKVDWVESD